MFYECKNLKNIDELKYLNTMFSDCSLLNNIRGLEKRNISNVIDFLYMFNYCLSLSIIKD